LAHISKLKPISFKFLQKKRKLQVHKGLKNFIPDFKGFKINVVPSRGTHYGTKTLFTEGSCNLTITI
jgi:hypothetical protein